MAFRELITRFRTNERGNIALIVGLSMPIIVGAEQGMLLYKQRQMQHAADSGALSAAVAAGSGVTDHLAAQAQGVASSYGFTNGTSGVTVTVNFPPLSGTHQATAGAVEVIVAQNQPRLFSAIWSSQPIPVSARAVAVSNGQGCVLALDPTANGAASMQGSVNLNLVKCNLNVDSNHAPALSVGGASSVATNFVGVVGTISGTSNITATNGIKSGYQNTPDPYASTSYAPYSGCNQNNYSTHGTVTLNPGVYCGGISLGAGATATLNPGVYYLDGGSLDMKGSSSLTGTGVTLVFTSSSGSGYATANLVGGATINLTAPTTGPTAGIAIFGDRNMPVGTSYSFKGGASQIVQGAVYLAKGAVSWSGNPSTTSTTCTQLVADTISFVGNSSFAVNCSGVGTKSFGSPATLQE